MSVLRFSPQSHWLKKTVSRCSKPWHYCFYPIHYLFWIRVWIGCNVPHPWLTFNHNCWGTPFKSWTNCSVTPNIGLQLKTPVWLYCAFKRVVSITTFGGGGSICAKEIESFSQSPYGRALSDRSHCEELQTLFFITSFTTFFTRS